ncbi:MAG: hypothetical protein V7672_10100 [Brevundimonas sp.]|uniref:glycine-rich domain-containing protein n=1 Tax=Brevundimonas sp. TaxID=1871086 RepID=UPI0030024EC9
MSTLQLELTTADAISADVAARLARLEAWDLSWASREAARRCGWKEDYAANVEREYRRFLSLTVIAPDGGFGMAGDVDEIWHQHILDTQDYAEMCGAIAGAFIHHCPLRSTDEASESSYERETLPSLRRLYGEVLSPVWPPEGAEAVSASKCCSTHG